MHAAWVLNRFAALGGFTPYERMCNAAYSGRLLPFGEPVFAQIVPKKKGNAKWIRCVFLSKSPMNDMYIVSSRSGVRLSRSVRRTGHEWHHDKALVENLKGFSWDHSMGVIGTRLVPPARQRRPLRHHKHSYLLCSYRSTCYTNGDARLSPDNCWNSNAFERDSRGCAAIRSAGTTCWCNSFAGRGSEP